MSATKEPDYKRPFNTEDFRGYFTWKRSLTKKLGCNLHHACHLDELFDILNDNLLDLRSKWSLELPAHKPYSVPGVWTGLNYFQAGNHYGPYLIKFPLSVLNGKSFMLFRREGGGRNRYFFVQYEAKIPVYSFKDNSWQKVNPDYYFRESGDEKLTMQVGAIYDIILTEPISIKGATIQGVKHPKCIPGKCKGITIKKSREIVTKIAKRKFRERLKKTIVYQDFVSRFPDLEGEEIRLPYID